MKLCCTHITKTLPVSRDFSTFFQIPTDSGICCAFNFDTGVLHDEVPMNKDLLSLDNDVPIITSKNAKEFGYDFRPAPGSHKGLQVSY